MLVPTLESVATYRESLGDCRQNFTPADENEVGRLLASARLALTGLAV